MHWFEVDKQGLARLLERKGKAFALFELIQNAWDTRSTEVNVTLSRISGTRRVRLAVEDDNPEGFGNYLSHAFTLFADSSKKRDAQARGRFNLGEKLVLALCDEAEIASTKGSVMFTDAGRINRRTKRERGSVFEGVLKMTDEEMQECAEAVRRLIPPPGIITRFNGSVLPQRPALDEFEATLLTEIADADGVLRRAQRRTTVRVVMPAPGETPMLYEMGIPVVETGDRWHCDIQQKIPLNFDRDNVPPSYLARVRALMVERMQGMLTEEDANAPWVRDAMQKHGDELSDATVSRVLDLRFGEKRCAYDPSDPEANNRAVSKGYALIYGSQLSKEEWGAVRRAGAVLPAGQVTPTPKPFSDNPDAMPLKVLPPEKWTPAIAAVADYAERIGKQLLGCPVMVAIASDISWPFSGAFGAGRLTLNLGRLGHGWFERADLAEINQLLIHEFGHHYCGNHLSADYHEALCKLGGKLTQLAIEDPELFDIQHARDASLKTARP